MNPRISKLRKRDGTVVEFVPAKIRDAIHKAMVAVVQKDGKAARKVSEIVIKIIEKRFVKKIPSVEDVQDTIEEVLKKSGYERVAEEYSIYRKKKAEIRRLRSEFGIEPKLTVNAMEVLNRRYLLRNADGKIVETPAQMFRRVARTIAEVDKIYGGDAKKSEDEFYRMMTALDFLPNSPTLFNAGAPLKQLSACFVLPIEDSLQNIFDAVKEMVLIEQTGGGVGFNFSNLRPKGDLVRSTKGVASGPVSFMRVFDTATEIIKSGGKRRGAMMGILRIDHPDILEFIAAKSREEELKNFNLSVAVDDDFIRAVKEDATYNLINPRTGDVAGRLKARKVWDLITEQAWRTGDPGVLFIDEINRHNPTPKTGKIDATNPCGELPLLPFESCNLGSINIGKMIKEGDYKIDWERLNDIVKTTVHFLDNVITANRFPLNEIRKITNANRKIGLGIMGWAEFLIKLGIPYDSNKALKLAEAIMEFIDFKAKEFSIELARERGAFPNFMGSIYDERGICRIKNLVSKEFNRPNLDWEEINAGLKKYGIRNATVTSIAPTGSISIIAGCSSGIEPLFAVSFMREVLEGTRLFEVNPIFERIAKEKGFYSTNLLRKIAEKGSIQGIEEVPEDVKKIFKTALDIKPEWHVRMQAAFQKYVDNSVSKTINLLNNARKEDVKKAIELAYKLKCKGITIYRYGSKAEQVLYIGALKQITAGPEYAGGCPKTNCPH